MITSNQSSLREFSTFSISGRKTIRMEHQRMKCRAVRSWEIVVQKADIWSPFFNLRKL